MFGSIGRRTRYHVSLALFCMLRRINTRFWVSESVVRVSSVVTAREAFVGCDRTIVFFATGAQLAMVALVSVVETGYLTTVPWTWIEYVSVGATTVPPTTEALNFTV